MKENVQQTLWESLKINCVCDVLTIESKISNTSEIYRVNNALHISVKALHLSMFTVKCRTFPSKLPSSILPNAASCCTLAFSYFNLFLSSPVIIW